MNQTIIEKFNIETSVNGWGNITEFKTNIGTFKVYRKNEIDYMDTTYIIAPQGFIKAILPKLKDFRRSNTRGTYTCKIVKATTPTKVMEEFLPKLNEQIENNNHLYHNQFKVR